jgi:hypothetical protein
MRVFVAGASGAIGQPLITELVRQGHAVTGMTRSEAGAQRLRDIGASVAQTSAFDGPAVEQALRRSQAEVVVDELTALPKDPSEMAAAAPGDRKLRLEGARIFTAPHGRTACVGTSNRQAAFSSSPVAVWPTSPRSWRSMQVPAWPRVPGRTPNSKRVF